MHSSEATAPAGGPGLLLQLGRLILRARSASSPAPPTPPTPRHKHKPGTSQQVLIQSQPTTDEEDDRLEDMFRNHVNALWTENVPICVEVILAPSCAECAEGAGGAGYPLRGLLLERWTMTTVLDKSESPAAISSPWLLNAVRSQLHFSQLAAWRARTLPAHAHLERRRKLSREINIKKIEANVDERELNVVYSVRAPPEAVAFATPPAAHTFPLTDIGSGKYLKVILESLPRLQDIPEVPCACRPPHTPHPPHPPPDELALRLNDLTIGSRKFEGAINSNIGTPSRRLSIISSPGSDYFLKDKLLDDRMHTNCSENGKHKCNCDEESDTKEKNLKKLDERRIKEIAKYRRRIRKENRKFCDSTSSEGELKKETTSIPILQAARFDRFRAIGCYRNQTYLTLPATRMETKSPFVNTDSIIPPEFKTKTIATQTDFTCPCGNPMEMKCDSCVGMVRSDGSYNLSSLQENGTRRKLDDGHLDQSLKKQKCDNINSVSCNGLIKRPKLRRFFPIVDKLEKIVSDRNRNTEKDIQELHLKTDDSVFSTLRESQKSDVESNSQYHNVKEPLRTEPKEIELKYSNCNDSRNSEINSCDYIPVYEKSKNPPEFTENLFTSYKNTKIPSQYAENKFSTDKECKSVQEVTDAHVSTQKESKRQKTFSISDDDYVLYEKCDYGTIDRHEIDSPNEERPDFKFSSPESQLNGTDNLESSKDEFIFPDPKPSEEPSPSELDRFRCGFDSAASMLFHAKTGLPLTSSPAPLRRGNNCFDFDDSINGISGIKSALFAPLSPSPSPCPSSAPAPSPARPPPPRHRREGKKPTSSGLLGSFEESALQGRLEAVATVHGFTAELGASGAFCPPHKRLPVTVFFYAPGGTAAPYMGHINLGPGGYRVARSGSVQVSLFNPHGTLVKMFVVLYDLTRMPPAARTFLRQRTLHQAPQATRLRYLIHLRFMTSKSGKLYLHTDIRLIVSRKADLDTAVSHAGPPRPLPLNPLSPNPLSPNPLPQRAPNRVFGGSSEHDSETEFGYDSSLSYDLRSVTCAPDNPKYSPR